MKSQQDLRRKAFLRSILQGKVDKSQLYGLPLRHNGWNSGIFLKNKQTKNGLPAGCIFSRRVFYL